MSICTICGSDVLEGAKGCPICGSSLEDFAPVTAPSRSINPEPTAAGLRVCPECDRRYDASYDDTFCECGSALVSSQPQNEQSPDCSTDVGVKAIAHTGPRLVVYSQDKQPIFTFALDRDVTRIGRTDAVRGDFVELDVRHLFDEATSRKVSRQHCLVLRSRETGTFCLRPLAGNTGTQVGDKMAEDLLEYPLAEGTRVVLGGVVRIKFHAE